MLSFFGELLQLPFVHVAHPFPAYLGRWADPRVADNMIVTQGLHVRAVLFDPSAELISSADGPMTRDEDIDVTRHALEQSQRGEVVLDRVSGTNVERDREGLPLTCYSAPPSEVSVDADLVSAGSVAVKRAPPAGTLLAIRSPPCTRRMRRAMVSPSPAPPVLRLRESSPR